MINNETNRMMTILDPEENQYWKQPFLRGSWVRVLRENRDTPAVIYQAIMVPCKNSIDLLDEEIERNPMLIRNWVKRQYEWPGSILLNLIFKPYLNMKINQAENALRRLRGQIYIQDCLVHDALKRKDLSRKLSHCKPFPGATEIETMEDCIGTTLIPQEPDVRVTETELEVSSAVGYLAYAFSRM